MKKTLLIFAAAVLALTGCGSGQAVKTDAGSDTSVDLFREQLEWCNGEIARLNRELLEAKSNVYIAEAKTDSENSADVQARTEAETELPVSADAAVPFAYREASGLIIIEKYLGSAVDATVPSHIDGKPVISIGDNAFEGSDVRSVIISDGIERIGWFAFSKCSDLCSISIPASVSSIEYGAFDYCSKQLTIHCNPKSYAEKFANSFAIRTDVH